MGCIIMYITDTFPSVQQNMTGYILSTIVAFGSLDHIILSRKQRRSNSCSIYLLATSFFGLIITNWAIISLVYAIDHTDLVSTSL
ncbi:unnamed protein product [Adineta steineri]|uniref:Uncharacterized protein n=2 Tax=Adineta steineri TaxID=433720 RepID=A0A818IBT4_9BILA|nr:unnamed protein product [Adineta steineri]CAF4148006.1 unnamed protein product [Adineta steineri]